jgi:AcrR family transcriptional regulator
MPRDSAATQARILDAAIAEFSARGLAGARIDRIAELAQANKRSLYVYFGDKEGLFNAALLRVISELIDAVPLTEQDLPGYAGRMFDHLLSHPEAVRLSLWRRLERPTSGPGQADVYAEKIEAMAGGHTAANSGIEPTDLIVLVIGLANAWFISPGDLLAADGRDPHDEARISEHRAAIVESARRVCGSPAAGPHVGGKATRALAGAVPAAHPLPH